MFDFVLVFLVAQVQVYRILSLDEIPEYYKEKVDTTYQDPEYEVTYFDDDLRQDLANVDKLKPPCTDNVITNDCTFSQNWPSSQGKDYWDCFTLPPEKENKTLEVPVTKKPEAKKPDEKKPKEKKPEEKPKKPKVPKEPSSESVEKYTPAPPKKKICVEKLKVCTIPMKKVKNRCPKNCVEVEAELGSPPNGVYEVWPSGLNYPIRVYCDMKTTHGGWTVIQRRHEGEKEKPVSFTRSWLDYRNGFGELHESFWLGADAIHALVQESKTCARVDYTYANGSMLYAEYKEFKLDSIAANHKSLFSGNSGTACRKGDCLMITNKFDNLPLDPSRKNVCADCFGTEVWYNFYGDTLVRRVEMKIRPCLPEMNMVKG